MNFYKLTTKEDEIVKYTVQNSISKYQIPRNIANERHVRLLHRKLLRERYKRFK